MGERPAATGSAGGSAGSARGLFAKVARFAAVSCVAVPVTQGTLWLLNRPLGWPAAAASVVAVAVGAVPAFFISRAWVWGKRGNHSLSREMAPFWAYNLVGLALSSVVVWLVEGAVGGGAAAAGLAPNWPVHVAHVATFAVIWVGKFVLADRVLFVARGATATEQPRSD